MFDKLKKIYENIKHINKSVNDYKQDSIIQSLPSVAYVNRAKKLIAAKDYDSAIKVLNSALDITDKDALVYKYLGKIYETKHDFKKACEYYEKSARINQNDKDIWLRLAMSCLYSDNLDRALETFDIADKVSPFNTDVYTGRGMTYMKQKKYSLAKDQFNIAAGISKYNFTAILLSAVMEIKLEEYTSAEEKLTFLVKVAPNEGCLYEYAHLKFLQNKYDEAEIYALKTLSLNKFMLPSYLILGDIYAIQKDYEKTEQVYLTAENYKLCNGLLYYEWGKNLLKLLKFEEAEEKFKKALEKDKDFIDAKAGLALLCSLKGDYSLLGEIKEKNVTNVFVQEAIGIQETANENYEAALEMFKKASNNDSSLNYINYLIAKCYIPLNRPYKVREYFDKFTQQNPQYIEGFIDYAKWLIKNEDFDEAQRKLKKALKIDNKNNTVLNLLFFAQYTLVKNNICEYNIKEAISTAQKAADSGEFNYLPQMRELESMLENIKKVN